jgi:hypothetical protein
LTEACPAPAAAPGELLLGEDVGRQRPRLERPGLLGGDAQRLRIDALAEKVVRADEAAARGAAAGVPPARGSGTRGRCGPAVETAYRSSAVNRWIFRQASSSTASEVA